VLEDAFLSGTFAAALSALGLQPAPVRPATLVPPKSTTATVIAPGWQLVGGKHWQKAAMVTAVAPTPALQAASGTCPADMVAVAGRMKLDPPRVGRWAAGWTVEEMQKTACTKWINRDYPERCAEFDRDRWLAISKDLPSRAMSFCIDRYEWPNRAGEHPMVMVSWPEAEAMCSSQGKRLCDEDEWTFACEGEEATPYPYGYVRDPNACVVDRPWRAYVAASLHPRDQEPARTEIARLWQGAASGEMPACVSPFGVHDMTGNVDEWTRGTRHDRKTILKGGYWGPVRTRCRPSTRSHDDRHVFYQQGFRCCS
jgi:hypothetical protein